MDRELLVEEAGHGDHLCLVKVEHLPEMLCKVIRMAGLDRSPALVVSSSEEVPTP
ncbi:hypothetical protein ABGB12_20485 [Actinocorallia sp. B10E7]